MPKIHMGLCDGRPTAAQQQYGVRLAAGGRPEGAMMRVTVAGRAANNTARRSYRAGKPVVLRTFPVVAEADDRDQERIAALHRLHLLHLALLATVGCGAQHGISYGLVALGRKSDSPSSQVQVRTQQP